MPLVKDVMKRTVKTIAPGSSIREAAGLMRDLDIGALPVEQDGRTAGIVTDRDIVIRGLAEGRDPIETEVRDVMTVDVISIGGEQELAQAAELMGGKKVRRLLVADSRGRPVGILSQGDMALSEHGGRLAAELLEKISRPD